jgi:hypothetical protein
MIDSGAIDERAASRMRKLIQESQEENLGYLFLTFSHSDEARLFLMEHVKTYLETTPIEVSLKSNVDHSHLDTAYFLAKARNDAKTVEEIARVREARQKLREFEAEMDKELPSKKKLKAARQAIRSLVEDKAGLSRDHRSDYELTQLERDRMDANARKLEAINPGLDVTAMYGSDDTDEARKALHKKAYASYKAFQFLKHGIKRKEAE